MLRRTAVRTFRIARFVGYFVYELVISNIQVTWAIIRPREELRSVVIAMPLRSETLLERTTFIGIVTLTPGTLSLEAQDEPAILYLHVMHTLDVERFREKQRRYEDLMLAALRPVGADGADPADRTAPAPDGTGHGTGTAGAEEGSR